MDSREGGGWVGSSLWGQDCKGDDRASHTDSSAFAFSRPKRDTVSSFDET